ncbi:MAG: hypothetical protein H6869_08950 [Rhodospirillales bacterium]|nr:hypothetical protein [Rhodospirillales bacterium]
MNLKKEIAISGALLLVGAFMGVAIPTAAVMLEVGDAVDRSFQDKAADKGFSKADYSPADKCIVSEVQNIAMSGIRSVTIDFMKARLTDGTVEDQVSVDLVTKEQGTEIAKKCAAEHGAKGIFVDDLLNLPQALIQ